MTANEIPVGAGFLGSVDREDWHANWKPGKAFPGDLVRVALIVPGVSPESYLKELIKLHANHLHTDSGSQLSNRLSLWVVGVRDKRSPKVRLIDWDARRDVTHLEEIHRLYKEDKLSEMEICLENLEGREVPYL